MHPPATSIPAGVRESFDRQARDGHVGGCNRDAGGASSLTDAVKDRGARIRARAGEGQIVRDRDRLIVRPRCDIDGATDRDGIYAPLDCAEGIGTDVVRAPVDPGDLRAGRVAGVGGVHVDSRRPD